MKSILTWLGGKLSPGTGKSKNPPGAARGPVNKVVLKPRPRAPLKPKQAEPPEVNHELGGSIEDGGPGKNVFVRSKYVREDTGTHDNLKILDDSIQSPEDEDSGDPYNTGRFDRSRSWQSRSRK